jgi:hypothetical protein
METWSTNPASPMEKYGSTLKRASRRINNPYATPLTTALGWISIGLGLAEILAPRQLSSAIGVRNHPVLLRSLGMREIAAGVAILTSREPSRWLWGRVAGDAMDLGLLVTAFETDKRDSGRLSSATAIVAGIAALDVFAALRQANEERR